MFVTLTGYGLFNLSTLMVIKSGYKGIIIFLIPFITFIMYISNKPQNQEYWQNAAAGKIKIYTISFTDNLRGNAVAVSGENFVTFDGGEHWQQDANKLERDTNKIMPLTWQAELFCSVMLTTDNGITWLPYEKKEQEHFCSVYLKDQNTGYLVASSFLSTVTREIFKYLKKDEISFLIDNPRQCTEYYKSSEEGWALGWCLKNFNLFQAQ